MPTGVPDGLVAHAAVALDHGFQRVALTHAVGGAGDRAPASGVVGDDLAQHLAPTLQGRRRDEVPGEPVLQHLGHGGHGVGDDGRAAGHGFEHRHRLGLGAARQAEHIGLTQHPGNVGAPAAQPHPIGDGGWEARDGRGERVAVRALAPHVEGPVEVVQALADGPHKQVDLLDGREPGGGHQPDRPRPRLAWRAWPVRAGDRLDVDAVGNDPPAPAVEALVAPVRLAVVDREVDHAVGQAHRGSHRRRENRPVRLRRLMIGDDPAAVGQVGGAPGQAEGEFDAARAGDQQSAPTGVPGHLGVGGGHALHGAGEVGGQRTEPLHGAQLNAFSGRGEAVDEGDPLPFRAAEPEGRGGDDDVGRGWPRSRCEAGGPLSGPHPALGALGALKHRRPGAVGAGGGRALLVTDVAHSALCEQHVAAPARPYLVGDRAGRGVLDARLANGDEPQPAAPGAMAPIRLLAVEEVPLVELPHRTPGVHGDQQRGTREVAGDVDGPVAIGHGDRRESTHPLVPPGVGDEVAHPRRLTMGVVPYPLPGFGDVRARGGDLRVVGEGAPGAIQIRQQRGVRVEQQGRRRGDAAHQAVDRRREAHVVVAEDPVHLGSVVRELAHRRRAVRTVVPDPHPGRRQVRCHRLQASREQVGAPIADDEHIGDRGSVRGLVRRLGRGVIRGGHRAGRVGGRSRAGHATMLPDPQAGRPDSV